MKLARMDGKAESLRGEKKLSEQEEKMLALAEKCLRTAKVYSLLGN